MDRKLVVGICAFGLVVVAIFSAWTFAGSGENQRREALAAQLSTAYPAERPPDGDVREFDLTAAPTTVDLTEGVTVDVWAYEGTVPGPELRVALGDTVVVNLRNELPQATSIHWHGVRVPNAMDGVPGVNQEAVPPGDEFRYEFVPKDAGTFWFHSHNRGSEQIERGLYGSLVVIDPDEPEYDQDLVWVIDDWLLDQDGSLIESFNEPHDVSHNGRWGNVVTTNGQINPTVDVQPGERVRARIINASNARVVAPNFGGLEAVVIAVDGMLARDPSLAEGFVLAPGNRIDVDITMPAEDQTVVVSENFNGEGFDLVTISIAGDPLESETFDPPMNTAVPTLPAGDLGIDHEYTLDFVSAMRSPQWAFNGRPFSDTETFEAVAGDLQTIRLNNTSQALHPIHFHGQFFKVLGADGSSIDEPFLRDTVLVFPGQTVDIAMLPVDIGTWAVHCHIQEHAEAGMMTLLEVSA